MFAILPKEPAFVQIEKRRDCTYAAFLPRMSRLEAYVAIKQQKCCLLLIDNPF